jgi:DNA adenine methylase
MKYMGSKRKLSKHILPLILQNRKSLSQWYVEPFVGGCNIIDKVKGNRIGNDLNKYVIALFKEMQKDNFELPSHISETDYKEIQDNKDNYPNWLVGYVGFNLSFGAKFFGGYGRDSVGVRDYENEAQRNLKAQQKYIKDIIFYNLCYKDLIIPENSIIYCDPPYQETQSYYEQNFNSEEFWDYCRFQVSKNNLVYISEYNAPKDFIIIFSKSVVSSLDLDTGNKTAIERLFIHKSQYNPNKFFVSERSWKT